VPVCHANNVANLSAFQSTNLATQWNSITGTDWAAIGRTASGSDYIPFHRSKFTAVAEPKQPTYIVSDHRSHSPACSAAFSATEFYANIFADLCSFQRSIWATIRSAQ
jgi:hypothetical protein